MTWIKLYQSIQKTWNLIQMNENNEFEDVELSEETIMEAFATLYGAANDRKDTDETTIAIAESANIVFQTLLEFFSYKKKFSKEMYDELIQYRDGTGKYMYSGACTISTANSIWNTVISDSAS